MIELTRVQIKFSVEIEQLTIGLERAQSAVKENVDAMKSPFEALKEVLGRVASFVKEKIDAVKATFETLKGALDVLKGAPDQLSKAFTALNTALTGFADMLGGGETFGPAIKATREMTGEAAKLSAALGVNSSEASVLRVALKGAGMGTDTYIAASTKLTQQLQTNETGLRAMGVQTRGANGELLSGQQAMASAIAGLGSYADTAKRTAAAQALFGVSAADSATLLGLTAQQMDETKARAESLGLVVGSQQAGEAKAYEDAMANVGLVLDGVSNAVGQALMPVLTQMAEWFAATGPARVAVMRTVMEGVADVFRIVFKTALTLKDIVADCFSRIGDAIGGGAGQGITAMQFLTNVMTVVKVAALGLENGLVIVFEVISCRVEVAIANLQGFAAVAQAAFRLDWAGVKAAWSDHLGNVEKIVNDSAARIATKSAQIGEQIKNAMMGEPTADAPKPNAAGTPTPNAAGTTTTPPSVPATAGNSHGSAKERTPKPEKDPSMVGQWEAENNAAKTHYELTEGLRQRDLAKDVEYWNAKAALANKDNGDREKALAKATAAELALRKQTAAADRAMSAEKINEDEKAALAKVEQKKAQCDTDAALGKVSAAKMIEIERQLEEERFTILTVAQKEREVLVENDPTHSAVALQKEKAKLLELERAHLLNVAKLNKQAELERAQVAKQLQSSLESGFASVLTKFAHGTMTIRDLFKNMGKAIYDSLVSVFAGIAAKWMATQIANLLINKTTTAAEITSEVAKAGAGGVASMAAAPYPINLTAPMFGAAMAGAAASFGAVASAAGGYDIPAGVNPLTQLHQREMVLPAAQADVIRRMENGGAGDMNVTIAGQQLAGGFFLAHQSELVAALKKARRNGVF